MNNTEIAKFNMIEQQIRPWEVLDNQVLTVIEQLNREDFVDPVYQGLAYADCQIPLADGVRMLPPTVEGRMLQALLLSDDDQVLEVGSGSGYISACLASLAGHVKSIDANADIIERAQANVARLGIERVEFEQMSLTQLDAPESYDAIAVTASLPTLPQNLKQALKPGGRMFVICGYSPVMEALLITRVSASEWSTQSLFETDLSRLQTAG
jgi:protein-L-isoaspartate(D-aspartate) O-methyltransferase